MLAGRKRSATVISMGGRRRRQALQRAQCEQGRIVARERAERAEDGEGDQHRGGESTQRERHRAPRGERHGADRGGRVDGDEPGALVVADAEGAADVGQRHLGDVFVQAGQDHGQQHADQAGQDARAECGGRGAAAGGAWGGEGAVAAVMLASRQEQGMKTWVSRTCRKQPQVRQARVSENRSRRSLACAPCKCGRIRAMRRAEVASRAILACAWRDLSAGGLAPIWRHANQRRGFPCKP